MTNRRWFPICLAVSLLLTAWSASLARAELPARNFDVGAGDAETALRVFAKQAAVQLIFDPQIVDGLRTPAVRGQLTPDNALREILVGTPLQVVRDDLTGALAIKRKSDSAVTETESGRVLHAAPKQISGQPTSNTPAMSKPSQSPRFRSRLWSRLLSGLAVAAAGQLGAQTASPKAPADEPTVLSPFTVSMSLNGDRYQPAEATSGGRVRVNLFDSSQNVSVITGELIGDIAATRILDAMKFVAGVSESSIPNGLDRITIRGFLTTLRTVDGITSTTQANTDPFLIERIEIVKGPNAVLAPAGVPGGTINNVSKKPAFRDFGSVSIEVGRFDSERAEFDLNRVFGPEKKIAVRLLGVAQDTKDYFGMPKKLYVIAPMLAYRFSPGTELTWQTHYINWKIQNYDGLAIDPTAGTNNTALLYQGVPRDLNIYGPDSYRQDARVEHSLLFLSRLSESLALRVQSRLGNQFDENNNGTTLAGGSTSAGTNANSFDPLTGAYTPGIVYATTAPFATTPVAISRTYNRSGSLTDQSSVRFTFQTDLAHHYETDAFGLESLLGYAYTNDRGHDFRNATTAPTITLENFVYSPDVVGAVSRNQLFHNLSNQVFISERLTFLQKRLILNGGYSRNYWSLSVDDKLAKNLSAKPSAGMVTYGAVIKPLPAVALFYSHSQNAAPLPVANIAAGGPPLQTGVQDEGGVRVHLLEKRLRLSLSRYAIQQNNTNVPNPGNFAFPPPVPTLPGLLADRTAKGWEFEAQGSLTSDLSVVAAYTNFKNRNPFGQEFRGAAEETWSALLHYSFAAGTPFHGFAVSLSSDYLSKRAGDDASGFTPTGVARRPTFYLPARTLVNLGLSYKFNKAWLAQLNIDNLLNREYLTSSLSRGIVWPGTPMNARLKLTYKF